MQWDFREQFSPGDFDIITASPHVKNILWQKQWVFGTCVGPMIWSSALSKSFIISPPGSGGLKTPGQAY
jgi:hypothetical protein